MGVCSSRDSIAVATAKLVLQNGNLMEFSYPTKVSCVLQKNPGGFICNSDDMEFDDVAYAMDGDEELHPGQLYFALPLGWLKRPLLAEEMAALAVKASSALVKCGGGIKKMAAPAGYKYRGRISAGAVADGTPLSRGRSRGGLGGGGRNGKRKFTAKMSVIEE